MSALHPPLPGLVKWNNYIENTGDLVSSVRLSLVLPGASRPRTPARGVIARGVLLVPFG